MEHIVKLDQIEIDILQASLDLLNNHMLMSVGGIKELNKQYGNDPERKDLLESSDSIIKDIEKLSSKLEEISQKETKSDFVNRRKSFLKNRKNT